MGNEFYDVYNDYEFEYFPNERMVTDEKNFYTAIIVCVDPPFYIAKYVGKGARRDYEAHVSKLFLEIVSLRVLQTINTLSKYYLGSSRVVHYPRRAPNDIIMDILLGYTRDNQVPRRAPNLLKETSSRLNGPQRNAVRKCLNKHFSCIQGPPGTGKTHTAVQLVREFYALHKKILVCAGSNAATDVIAQKIYDELSYLRP